MRRPSKHAHRSERRVVAAIVALALGLAAVGCGTSRLGSSPPPTSTPATGVSFPPRSPVDSALGVSATPVVPLVTYATSTFEGSPVESYVPPDPVGVVYFFHGSGGAVDFVDKVETVDVVNELVRRGYGVVATQSTNRSTKQWDVDDPSMSTNADLARIDALRRHVIATTPVTPSTPTYGIGMSNGSAFCALWAAASTKAGVHIAAVGLYMAGPTRAVARIGGLRVPTFMVVGVNDTRTNPAKEKADLAAIAAAGVATELEQVPERPVTSARYLRVPGITTATADAIVAAYRRAGVIDESGQLIVTLPRITAQGPTDPLPSVTLPAGLSPSQRQAVNNETLATIGEHQFNAEFRLQNATFFDQHAD